MHSGRNLPQLCKKHQAVCDVYSLLYERRLWKQLCVCWLAGGSLDKPCSGWVSGSHLIRHTKHSEITKHVQLILRPSWLKVWERSGESVQWKKDKSRVLTISGKEHTIRSHYVAVALVAVWSAVCISLVDKTTSLLLSFTVRQWENITKHCEHPNIFAINWTDPTP